MDYRLTNIAVAAVLAVSSHPASAPPGATPWARVAPMPIPAGATLATVHDVTVQADNDVWAVGAWWLAPGQSKPMLAHWDGAAWASASPPGAEYDLTAVDAATPDDVWATANERSGAVLLHREGATWSETSVPQPPGTISALTDIDLRPTGDGWAVGYRDAPNKRRQALILRRQSGQWTEVSVPADVASMELNSVFAGATDAWAVGVRTGDDDSEAGVVLHYDGHDWHGVPVPDGASPTSHVALNSVAEATPTQVWVVGGICTTRLGMDVCRPLALRLVDGAWQTVPAPGLVTELTEVVPRTYKDVFMTGYTYSGLPNSEHDQVEHWDGTKLTPEQVLGGVSMSDGEPASALSAAALNPTTGALWAVGWTVNSAVTHVLRRS